MQVRNYTNLFYLMLGYFRQYYRLSKFSLSFLVVFSSVMSYLLAEHPVYDIAYAGYLSLGGFLVTAGANIINQIVEKETDAKMHRTRMRPVASGAVSKEKAAWMAAVSVMGGGGILWYHFTFYTMLVAMISVILYAWVYTPMKKQTSFSVIVGAIPGALPCFIGWLAGGGDRWEIGLLLFFFQFVWQFPHFWAIAWLAHEDYARAGLRLLPSVSGPSRYAALQSVFYASVLLPLGLVPYLIKMAGWMSAIVIFFANAVLLYYCIRLYIQMNNAAARRVMFASYIHLPVFFFALLFDKNW